MRELEEAAALEQTLMTMKEMKKGKKMKMMMKYDKDGYDEDGKETEGNKKDILFSPPITLFTQGR